MKLINNTLLNIKNIFWEIHLSEDFLWLVFEIYVSVSLIFLQDGLFYGLLLFLVTVFFNIIKILEVWNKYIVFVCVSQRQLYL